MTTTRKTNAKPKPQPLTRETATPDQWRCFEVVAMALDTYTAYLKAIPWGDGIRVSFLGYVATHDSNLLTRLVLAAHRYAIRIAVTSGGPRRVAIEAHPRDPNSASHMKRHPSLDELQAMADQCKHCVVADAKGGE